MELDHSIPVVNGFTYYHWVVAYEMLGVYLFTLLEYWTEVLHFVLEDYLVYV